MITLSNGLSFIRAPLALLFLQSSPSIRFLAVLLAMITDSVDGYLARRSRSASKFGAILDPAMDKFFVYFALTVFYLEGRTPAWEAVSMLSRDFFVGLYGIITLLSGRWKSLALRPLRWGKVSTALQFLTLMGITCDMAFPWYWYAAFIAMGCFAFLELVQVPFFSGKQQAAQE